MEMLKEAWPLFLTVWLLIAILGSAAYYDLKDRKCYRTEHYTTEAK